MVLGKETASVHNQIMSQSTQEPVVGKGMTRLMWTDRKGFEVVHVSGDGKTVFVQEYNYKFKTDSHSGYTELLDLQPKRIELRKRYGNWWVMYNGSPLYKWSVQFGTAETYIDPHF